MLDEKGGIQKLEDNMIVELYLRRDEMAIEYSAEKYGRRLRSLSLSLTQDAQTSEECENDTYNEAWKLIPPNEPRDYLYAFLARIIRHISIDRCRVKSSLKRNAYITELSKEMEMCIPAKDDVVDTVEAKELGKLISRFLYTLSKEKRVIFVRRYFYLDSIMDISKRCDISEGKVKTLLFRMRNELRKYLEKEGYSV